MRMKNHSGLLLRIVLLVSVLGAGIWLRTVQTKTISGEPGWRPWTTAPIVNLYFSDGRSLFPVSRRMPNKDDLPQAVLQALVAGPRPASGLKNLIPPGMQISSFRLLDGVARIEVSAVPDDAGARGAAETAIIETMTALPGVSSVALTVSGKPFGAPVKRVPLLYFASTNGLVATPVMVMNPRDALDAYLSGPPERRLIGLPSDVRLQAYDYSPADRLLSLKFSYTSSLRALAMDRPDRMRTVLLGLIASLTEFDEVRAVQLDFGGQTRLGLGQCSDLLRTPQPRPTLLNDERLL
jgi:spore germination protein GerM